jgi:hypothetical protein
MLRNKKKSIGGVSNVEHHEFFGSNKRNVENSIPRRHYDAVSDGLVEGSHNDEIEKLLSPPCIHF